MIYETSYNRFPSSSFHDLECKFKNTFGTGMCKFGLGDLSYRDGFGLVFIGVFKCMRSCSNSSFLSWCTLQGMLLFAPLFTFCFC